MYTHELLLTMGKKKKLFGRGFSFTIPVQTFQILSSCHSIPRNSSYKKYIEINNKYEYTYKSGFCYDIYKKENVYVSIKDD